jgi:1,4-alpha-glucan branching enzyme
MPEKRSSEKEYLRKIREEAERRHKKITQSQKKIKTDAEPAPEPVSEKEHPPLTAKIEDSAEPEISISIRLAESDFITDYDLHLFHAGTFYEIYRKFGAQLTERNGVSGVQFTTWAPNAQDISVIGEFNGWKEGQNEMTRLNDDGVWSLFIPGLKEGDTYKFSVKSKVDNQYRRKSDPYAFRAEHRPKNASVVADISKYKWNDLNWLSARGQYPLFHKSKPMNIYELHLGSWKRSYENNDFPNEWGYLNYRQLAHEIVAYVKDMGYTHIELMPVMEHPLDISWGYQVTCYYAPTSRFGTPEDFMYFVDHCHQNGIGVILDWVPAHFPTDEHSLAYFDGQQIYAYESIKKGVHKDWGTFIFDYGRNEVQNFLIGNALFWLDKYHADGLRVDAVASMLYLDYSRSEGEWEPNVHGGRENLEAINFLKHLNDIVHKYHPGTVMIAEESTAWPAVSRHVSEGGLGFDMKWNMGWMNDILLYFSKDPVYRKFHQGKITFSLWYAFGENFILPLSHDEVVHGKKSLLEKMPGDTWQKFANLRLLLGFMLSHPGKKLNFMANDIAQYNEWNSEVGLDWGVLDSNTDRFASEAKQSHDTDRFARSEATRQSQTLNAKFNLYMKDLNHLYKSHPALYEVDFDSKGFQWLDFSDAVNSVISFVRYSADQKEMLLFTFNMTPIQRDNYTIGVPKPGFYKEILNSNAAEYGGDGTGNMGGKHSEEVPHKEWGQSMQLTLPPLSMSIFKIEGKSS